MQHKTPDIDMSLSQQDFNRLCSYILANYGINLTPNKKELLEYRLHKRLRKLEMGSFAEYVRYLFSEEGQKKEPVELINEVSTNKTDFFREPKHFDLLDQKILPEIYKKSPSAPFPVWSAGCSSGEEVYTLAMIFENFKLTHPLFSYSLLGTDISESMLTLARRAIYPIEAVQPVKESMLKKYFLKSKDPSKKMVRVRKNLRDKTYFNGLNLMDDHYNTPEIYPIIFCRNTLIYFNKETKLAIIEKILDRLKTGGLLFISHTESLVNMNLNLKLIYPSVYQKIVD